MSAAKVREGEIWGSAPFEDIAAGAAPSHESLVAALRPAPGERWLDVATGTGAVALRAARAGATVTGVDLAPALLATARRRADEERLPIEFVVGDAEALPFPDASFDVVASAQGVIFASDQNAAARELARVCRPGGRLGLTCLVPRGPQLELVGIARAFGFPPVRPRSDPFAWGVRPFVERLLDDFFELEFTEIDAPVRGPDGAAIWTLYSQSYGPLKSLVAALPPPARDVLRGRVVRLYERYRGADGVCAPRPLLLVVGRRTERSRPALRALG